MIYLLVGHRGVGKTSLLGRIQKYAEQLTMKVAVVDLDSEIETATGKKIADIFNSDGEGSFRKIERQTLHACCDKFRNYEGFVFIAVGAGYEGEMPAGTICYWIRRETDRMGRIFLDRPRLNAQVSPLEEYLQRFDEREERYEKLHHRVLTLGEGWDFPSRPEMQVLGFLPASVPLSATMLPSHFEDPMRLELFVEHGLRAGYKYFELRDDLLSFDQIANMTKYLPEDKVLISFRSPDPDPRLIQLSGAYATDWAVELGRSPFEYNTIVSLHRRYDGETMEEAANRLLSMRAEQYKFAPAVNDFVELWSGHKFFQQDPKRHSFLPNSRSGRWSWYRALHVASLPLNFVRDGNSQHLDQPTEFDFLRVADSLAGRSLKHFAAVVGSPISHSRTPAEQHAHFLIDHLPVVAIEMEEAEFTSLNLGILHRLGCRSLAVTSPLKKVARQHAKSCLDYKGNAIEFSALNTLTWSDKNSQWVGTSTDNLGIESAVMNMALPQNVSVWGQGGVKESVSKVFPRAKFYSARAGVDSAELGDGPDIVVWAVGRSRMNTCQWPPSQWQPKYVLDLNYAEDSPGKVYAMNVGAKYISGLEMFKSQAKYQREFWDLPTI
jgi:shikimate 5-dehydrogenase/shikimate kinase